ncbi:serine/threonine-protein phosphatase 1 regulatory subunit 10 isoform X5 [Spodoptera frugiperda]|uniref:SFRICE_024374 n=1 Tax=Spodoptera frugiperda TaxID=7108 RepID=A0A2H1WG90_SPOFR|nr:serine/threonine-protein phosphatase 1 regulatory subunit 10 isoform X2 [Spodoptera frugiperda]XP_050554430.1 serine/threonine-protein phosphatase 1 regulatory subunit 10 isoform X3 [Spodoptera frugiperda]XP_050554454.1 serine/threonine-protein phosphatase 1 regulatory subunit 10 isoform X4 [Spodoptera frugiperda]XP_050554465.1 serine/threonine-protein phosphatase 1 regulatory subunit 10 isoform X5 [Spodoptera frugiperda]
MPRIDPVQLLNCLGVLLSPNGGIKSRDEVQRLASLMTKFSKKLVSKCIYIQILKCTETELLGLFMGSGGWVLVHMWLTESIVAKNWPLVKELLELLLLCPVDIDRLKTNNCPKLVKELSKDDNHFAIRALASKLVEQWLKTVKGEQVVPVKLSEIPKIISEAQNDVKGLTNSEGNLEYKNNDTNNDIKAIKEEIQSEKNYNDVDTDKNLNHVVKNEVDEEPEALPVLKISLKDGKQVISQVDDDTESKTSDVTSDSEKSKDKKRNKDRSDDKSSSSSVSKSSSSSKHSSRSHSSDKHKSHKSSSSRHSSSSSSSNKDRSRDKDRHSSHNSSRSKSESSRKSSDKSSSSSSKSKDERSSRSSTDKSKDKGKDDKNEKNKDNSLSKSSDKQDDKTPSVHKLGKIPKLSDAKKEKPSISIEVRKPDEPKPKTVKTFNSKFRKHGLEEEVKPPPSRAAVLTKKSTPVLPPTVSIPKRPSPVHNESPPEKKSKTIEPIEKPGSIKLIPPKPKPVMLLESDMFMDALNASATNKRDPKKRKRRTSGSKDGNSGPDGSPPQTPTSLSSPSSESKSVPPRFYQDTLETDENKEKTEKTDNENADENVEKKENEEEMDTSEPHTLTINGLKGVLCYHKRKGPKKSIKWKPDSELEEIQYFELDETERVNVTKTFTDMKYLERIHERDAFQKGRNLSNDDVMEEKTTWRPPRPIEVEGQVQVEHGKNSKEKEIQAMRQKGTLQPLYFSKSMIPDSALEPDPETHPYTEPTIIPLDDVTGNQDNISDFRNMPWPEPKGNAPPASANMNVPNMFPPNMNQFPNGFPNPQFPGVPGFQGGNIVPTEWPAGVPPHIMANGMPGPMPPGAIPPGNMPPGMMMPPENMMMGPEMFGGPNPMFPGPPEGFNMQQNMFPMDFNMSGPQGPPGPSGPDGFPGMANFRGAMRGRGAGGHWRGNKNPGNWEGPQRGGRGGARGSRKAVCIYFQRKGSCRQGDNCTFLHPGVNCPF